MKIIIYQISEILIKISRIFYEETIFHKFIGFEGDRSTKKFQIFWKIDLTKDA